MANEPMHINECLALALDKIDAQHARAEGWDLVKRNLAITARNRNMQKISEMLDMPFREMPLEKPEAA